jgi:hypothetical protein
MATPITKFVRVSTRLASKVVPAATFENGLFLGSEDTVKSIGTVPPDRRYLSVTADDFADYLAEGSEAYNYALAYFAQDYTPDALVIGRTFQAASAPYAIITGGVVAVATFEPIDDGALTLVDSDGNTVTLDVDFTGVTAYAQVLAKLNAALAACTYPAIPGLNECLFVLDNLERLVLFCPGTACAPRTKFPDADQTVGTYTGISAGKLKFSDNAETPNVVELTGLDFTSCTTFVGSSATTAVLGVINAALAALVNPEIKGLEDAYFALDNFDVLTLVCDPLTAGAAVPTVELVEASATGVDLYDASYFDGADQEIYEGADSQTGVDARTIDFEASLTGTDLFSASYLGDTVTPALGVDAETLSESLQEVQKLVAFYNVATYAEGGNTTIGEAEYLALAQYIETQVLQFDFLTYAVDTKDALVTDDLVSQLSALSLDRTTCYYTEQTDQRPDGANAGYVFPQKAGSCSFAYNTLSGVSESGLARTLTSAEMLALDGKHVIYMCRVADSVFPFKSLTCSGEEKRIILGIDWFNATCQIDVINDRLVKKIHTYDYQTFGAVELILRTNAKEAAARNILYPVDDVNYPFTVEMPDPSDFSAAEKKTHVFEREIFHGYIKSEILQWQISGTFEI